MKIQGTTALDLSVKNMIAILEPNGGNVGIGTTAPGAKLDVGAGGTGTQMNT